MGMRVGVDIGGTFIDFCLWDEAKEELHSLKVLTTPQTPGAELLRGLDLLQERARRRARPTSRSFVHGTTVGINTVIQRKGARAGPVHHREFRGRDRARAAAHARDLQPVLAPRRAAGAARPHLRHPRPHAVRRHREQAARRGVRRDGGRSRRGRKGVDGHRHLACSTPTAIRRTRPRSQAIVARVAPELFVFCSTEVWPMIREYERTHDGADQRLCPSRASRAISTALDERLAEPRRAGRAADHQVERRRDDAPSSASAPACSMLLSGTASGVIGASLASRRQRRSPTCITLDIGGTSADVALIIDGQPQFGTRRDDRRLPALHPVASSVTLDRRRRRLDRLGRRLGVLKVGPESAGSDAGPGLLRPRRRRGRRSPTPSRSAASWATARSPTARSASTRAGARPRSARWPAARLGRRADGARRSSTSPSPACSSRSASCRALRRRPRDFTLLPFGGAGPMLGCFLAREQALLPGEHPAAAGREDGAVLAPRLRHRQFQGRQLRPAAGADRAVPPERAWATTATCC